MIDPTRASQKQLGDARIADAMHARHDRWRDTVSTSYLICTSPRVGSHMLAHGLTALGAGKPVEYLNPIYIGAYTARLGVNDVRFDEYMHFLKHNRASDLGIFGVKAHFYQVKDIFSQPEQIHWLLGQFDRLVFLRRRNRVLQAVSYARAMASSTWFAGNSDEADVARRLASTYNGGAIAEALSYTMNDDLNWERALIRSGKPVHVLHYEDLVSDYAATISGVCDHLGLPCTTERNLVPLTQPLGDGLSVEWARRFTQEISGVAS